MEASWASCYSCCQFPVDCHYVCEFKFSGKALVNLFGINPCTCEKICLLIYSFSLPKFMLTYRANFAFFYRFLNWMSFSSVYQYTGKQGGFLASSGHRKMLHFKIVQGLHPLGPGLSMLWTSWGGGRFPYPHLSHHKTQLKNSPGAARRAHAKSLQANLWLDKFV